MTSCLPKARTTSSICNAVPNVIKEFRTLSCLKSQLKVHAINS